METRAKEPVAVTEEESRRKIIEAERATRIAASEKAASNTQLRHYNDFRGRTHERVEDARVEQVKEFIKKNGEMLEQPRDSYKKMRAELQEMVSSLDLSRSDIVEETLLTLAGVEEPPFFCQSDDSHLHCHFILGICEAAADQLVIFYNKKFPDLNVTNITKEAKEIRAQTSDAVQIISMNLSVLKNNVLPMLKLSLVAENNDVPLDVFEQTLLAYAANEDKLTFHQFGYETPTCSFILGISPKAAKQFVNYYKRRFPALNVSNITDQWTPDPYPLLTRPTQVITMNVDALRRYVLPLLRDYWRDNPAIVNKYFDLVCSQYPTSHEKIDKIFEARSEEPKNLTKYYIGESLVGATLQYQLIIANKLMNDVMPLLVGHLELAKFPEVLLDIILSYLLPSLSTKKAAIETLPEIGIPLWSRCADSKSEKNCLQVGMNVSQSTTTLMIDYFNSVIPESASICREKKEYPGFQTPVEVMNIKNVVLFHPTVYQALFKSDDLVKFRSSFVANLIKAKKLIKESKEAFFQNDNMKQCVASIKLLVEHIKNEGFVLGSIEKTTELCKSIRDLFKVLKAPSSESSEEPSPKLRKSNFSVISDLIDIDITRLEQHIAAVEAEKVVVAKPT